MEESKSENKPQKQAPQEEPKQGQEEEEAKQEDLLREALDGLDDSELNVTADEKDKEGGVASDELNKEYEALMKGFQDISQNIGGVEGMEKMFSELLKGVGADGPGAQQEGDAPDGEGKEDEFMKKLFHDMMDKELLEQPLLDVKKNYEEYFEKQQKQPTWTSEEEAKYREQHKCIAEMIDFMNKEPANKDALIEKFEQVMSLGSPPDDIMKGEGQNPFNLFAQLQKEGDGGGSDAAAQQLPQLFEKLLMTQPGNATDSANPDEQCCIY